MRAPTDDMLVSFSAADAFTGCERRYFYEKVMQEKQPETAPLVVGNVYHSAIAEMLRNRLLTPADAVASAAGPAAEALEAVRVDPDALMDEMEQNLTRLDEEVLAYVVPASCEDGGAFVEKKFEDTRLGYRGVIDVVSMTVPVTKDGTVIGWKPGKCVLDWKSLTSDRRRSDRDAKFSPQLGLYALAVQGATAAGFVEIPRDVTKPIKVRMSEYTGDTLANMDIWLRAIRATMISRGTDIVNYRMTERSNGLCSPSWCPFWFKCFPSQQEGASVK